MDFPNQSHWDGTGGLLTSRFPELKEENASIHVENDVVSLQLTEEEPWMDTAFEKLMRKLPSKLTKVCRAEHQLGAEANHVSQFLEKQ